MHKNLKHLCNNVAQNTCYYGYTTPPCKECKLLSYYHNISKLNKGPLKFEISKFTCGIYCFILSLGFVFKRYT